MKPYISKIYQLNGKTYSLPLPRKYRELLDCVHVLGIKKEADEESIEVIGYKALYVPEPDISCKGKYVERVAEELSKLNVNQVRAIGQLCGAFSLTFGDILSVLGNIYPNLKGNDDNED
jgi:hypothetical protein